MTYTQFMVGITVEKTHWVAPVVKTHVDSIHICASHFACHSACESQIVRLICAHCFGCWMCHDAHTQSNGELMSHHRSKCPIRTASSPAEIELSVDILSAHSTHHRERNTPLSFRSSLTTIYIRRPRRGRRWRRQRRRECADSRFTPGSGVCVCVRSAPIIWLCSRNRHKCGKNVRKRTHTVENRKKNCRPRKKNPLIYPKLLSNSNIRENASRTDELTTTTTTLPMSLSPPYNMNTPWLSSQAWIWISIQRLAQGNRFSPHSNATI